MDEAYPVEEDDTVLRSFVRVNSEPVLILICGTSDAQWNNRVTLFQELKSDQI